MDKLSERVRIGEFADEWTDGTRIVGESVIADEIATLERQRDRLLEALRNLVTFCESCNFDNATTGRQILMRDARAIIAESEAP